MKFTLSWLKEHLDTDAPLAQILDTLTAIGLEVEGVEDKAGTLKEFRVAHVIEAVKHPNADKLRLCTVDTGSGIIQVVCGAPNARTGMKSVLALPGMTVPRTGTVLKKGEIRGEASEGMLCSAYELCLSDDHEGIMDLPADAPVGQPFADVLGLNDPVIEIAITPNRADALGVRGVARDLAAAGLGRLKPRNVAQVPGAFKSPIGVTLDLPGGNRGDNHACPLFLGRLIRGVKNGDSPDWLKQRLQSIGLRPISVLVDITNLLTFDINRPLHVFDAAKLKGGLTVHAAKGGETLLALNGKDYTLEAGMTVISDASGVISLGGVIGGESTGCTAETTDVFLEAAWFDPLTTATTGRKLGIISDARYRFERGIDPAAVFEGMEAATRLILDLCGGEASEIVIAGAAPDTRRTVTLRPDRVASLGGVSVSKAECARILRDLGFEVTEDGDRLSAVPPSWRADIEGEADLVEEVLRINGIDKLPALSLPRDVALPAVAVSPRQKRVQVLRRTLALNGLKEAVTWSFMAREMAEVFGGGQADLAVLNPIASDLNQMRPTPLPNLLAAAARNLARGLDGVALFEIGPGFTSARPEGQVAMAVGLRVGPLAPRHWRGGEQGGARPVDAFDAKADLFDALRAMGFTPDALPIWRDAPGWYHPGRSGTVKLGPKQVIAQFGEIHPDICRRFDLDAPAVAFELFVDAVPEPKQKAGRARPTLKLSPFQPVRRDFAFLMDRDSPAEALLKAVRTADKALITDVAIFDVYAGKGIPDGKKSVAIAVTLQPVDRTLTDAEIDAIGTRIVEAVAKATGGSLRG